jgi:hypothetical protein
MLGTKDQADRRVFVCVGPMLSGIVEIEVHLSELMRSFA